MAERQKIIETNRSIRTIKNELESLLEKDIITYDSYQSIHSLLPAEASLHSAASTPQPAAAAARVASPAAPPPTDALNNLSLHNNNNAANNNHHPAPPSYHQTTAAAPPALPTRNSPAAVAPPSKPIIAHAKALYAYTASDARDVGFERNDTIQVYEYMNADWWMGRNERTGAEGIFPRTYVEALPGPPPAAAYNEKAMYGAPAQPVYGGYPPPQQQQQNPYNSSAPPMAVANDQQQQVEGESKAGGMGKKFGKKLGNAAIFGAGATIGSNIVNSIF